MLAADITQLDKTMEREQNLGARRSRSEKAFITPAIILTWLAVSLGFFYIDHNWTNSTYFSDIDESSYTGSENETADRLDTVNANSTLARVFLAGWGLLCFVTAPKLRFRLFNPAFVMAVIYGLMLFASVTWSILPSYTLFKLVVVATMLTAAGGIAARFSLPELFAILSLTLCTLICIGVLAELQLGKFRPWRSSYRFVGTSHPNTLAVYGTLLCVMSRVFFKDVKTWAFALSIAAIGFITVVLTKSRTSLLALVISLVVSQIVAIKGSARVILFVGTAMALGFLSIGSMLVSQQSMRSLGGVASMGRGEDVSSLTGRLPLWEELITWIDKRPLMGYGYLAFWDADRVEELSDTFKWEIPHGHNMYLDVTLDVGIVGCTAFVLWLLAYAALAFVRSESSGKPEYAAVCGIVVCAIVNGFGESLFKMPSMPLFVVVTAFFSLLVEHRSSTEDASSTVQESLRDN